LTLKNWFPHISPFFIIDRRKFQPIFEKTRLTIKQPQRLRNQRIRKNKNQEKTFQLLNELNTLQNQLSEIENQKTNLKNERLTIENEISKVEQQTTELKNKLCN